MHSIQKVGKRDQGWHLHSDFGENDAWTSRVQLANLSRQQRCRAGVDHHEKAPRLWIESQPQIESDRVQQLTPGPSLDIRIVQ